MNNMKNYVATDRGIENALIAPEKETIFNIALEMRSNAEELEKTIEDIRNVLYGGGTSTKDCSDTKNGCPNIEEILKDTNNLLMASRKALEYIKDGLV